MRVGGAPPLQYRPLDLHRVRAAIPADRGRPPFLLAV